MPRFARNDGLAALICASQGSVEFDYLDVGAAFAIPLRLIAGSICRGQYGVQAVVVGFEEGKADADPQPEGFAVPAQDIGLYGLMQLHRTLARQFRRTAFQQQAEFVPAQSGQRVAIAHHILEA